MTEPTYDEVVKTSLNSKLLLYRQVISSFMIKFLCNVEVYSPAFRVNSDLRFPPRVFGLRSNALGKPVRCHSGQFFKHPPHMVLICKAAINCNVGH